MLIKKEIPKLSYLLKYTFALLSETVGCRQEKHANCIFSWWWKLKIHNLQNSKPLRMFSLKRQQVKKHSIKF